MGALLFSCARRVTKVAVFPSTNAIDVLDVLEYDVSKAWKALSKYNPLLTELTYNSVEIHHDPIPRPDEKIVKAIEKANADEVSSTDIKRMLKEGRLALWWGAAQLLIMQPAHLMLHGNREHR